MPSPNWLSKGWEEMEAPEDQGLAGEKGSEQRGRGMMATQGDGLSTWVANQELQLHACMDENPLSRGSRRHLLLVKGEDIRGKEQGTKTKATHA